MEGYSTYIGTASTLYCRRAKIKIRIIRMALRQLCPLILVPMRPSRDDIFVLVLRRTLYVFAVRHNRTTVSSISEETVLFSLTGPGAVEALAGSQGVPCPPAGRSVEWAFEGEQVCRYSLHCFLRSFPLLLFSCVFFLLSIVPYVRKGSSRSKEKMWGKEMGK